MLVTCLSQIYAQVIESDTIPNINKGTVRSGELGSRSPQSTLKKDSTDKFYRNIFDILQVEDPKSKSFAWKLDRETYNLFAVSAFDSSLFLNHLILPGQKTLTTLSYLGNMGSPIIPDHFFERDYSASPYIFDVGYQFYQQPVLERKQFNVRKPHTLLEYSTGGKRRNAEQNLRVLHTQNVNRYLNLGLQYDYYSTKGMYENQLTRNNDFTAFASYYKHRLMAQGTFAYTYIKNQENGGLLDDKFIQDTVMEPNLVPFRLKGASSEYRKRSFAGFIGYDLLVKRQDSSDSTRIKSILNVKLIFDANRYSRIYLDTENDSSYYQNFYISSQSTHDSVYLVTYQSTALVELTQIAKYPGIPGLRAWVSNLLGSYYYFTPDDFIYSRSNPKLTTNHFGIGIFSNSPYFSYNGAARFYIDGYRAADKELIGKILISPWKSKELPYVSGEISITDYEPSIFMKQYFSNHFKWDNKFEKESRFRISARLGAERVGFEAGYNLVHMLNFTYFDTLSLPAQTSNITVTSAYMQKLFKLGGLHLLGKVTWQASTDQSVLSLPTLSGFGAIYYQYPLVKNALTVQLGISCFYRTSFYAEAYNPALGVYYNQQEREIGNYPFVDAFINARWKRTNIFVKFDHVNMGVPNNQYFTTLRYPYNPRMFKFGLSWMFYD